MPALGLPTPSFVDRDPAAVTQELIASFEAFTGRTLYPGQVESQLIDLVAYRESLIRIAIQEAAMQNLVAFARFPMLDFLGELVGVTRLPASAAATELRFTLSAAQVAAMLVPAGTVAMPSGSDAAFATASDLVIPAGELTGTVRAIFQQPGVGGNGHLPGSITTLAAPLMGVASVTNTSTSMGGADEEEDDRLRERIRAAPETFSVAGSAESYRARALSAHIDVRDVAITSPVPGTVRIAVLATAGVPSDELLDVVSAEVASDRVRPLTDTVVVVAAVRVPYAIAVAITPGVGTPAASALERVAAAAESFAAERRAGLGRSPVRAQLIAALMLPGIFDVVITSPAAEVVVGAGEWADCTGVSVELAGG